MPNTLAQLNTFSNQSYIFEDERPYSITFSANATTNQSVTTSEDSAFTSPVGIDITSVTSQPFDGSTIFGNITYNINTSNVGNAILSWPALPSSVSSSQPSTGVYRVSGIMDEIIWGQIKNPTIIVKDQATNFSYTANIVYPDMDGSTISEWTWTNNVIVSNTHSEMSNATGFTYDEDVAMTITGTPTITDTYSGPLPHTLVITPNVANAVFSLSMTANTSLNPVTKVLTIVDSKATINTALGNLWLIPGPDYDQTFSLNYSLTNPVSNLNTQVNQTATIGNTETDFTMTTSYNYAEGAATQLVFALDDGDPTATSFTISVDQTLGTDGIFFVNGSNFGVGNLASFTGNRTAFNGANITFLPNPDAADTINITANVYKINGVGNITVASNVVSTLTNTSSHAEFTLTQAYNFAEDTTVPMVFAITDTDANATNYLSTFAQTTGNTGAFFVNGTSQGVGNSAVLSNSKVNINAANVSFLPAADDTGNVGLTYTQVKTNTYFGNIIQANAVAIALTNNSSHNEYDLGGGYTENTLFNYGNIITDTDSRATSYTISLEQTAGNIGQWYLNGNLVGYSNSVYSASNSRANINSSNIQFLPAWEDRGNISITYNQTKVNSVFGNITQASNVVDNKTCVANVLGLANVGGITRTYFSNVANTSIYSTTTPVLSDGSDVGQTYEIRINSPFQTGVGAYKVGGYGPNVSNAISRAQGGIDFYSITGNTQQVNAQLANVVWAPASYVSHDSLLTLQGTLLFRDGVTSSKNALGLFTGNVLGANQNYANSINTFSSTGNYTPTASELYYGGSMQIVAVGGGGGGATVGKASGTGPDRSGGGGGGGALTTSSVLALSNVVYSVNVGVGGQPGLTGNAGGNVGGTSYVANIAAGNITVAAGGNGAVESPNFGIGGNSDIRAGGARGDGAIGVGPYFGGGGAGAGAVGGAASNVSAGIGGAGVTSNISGSNVTYGGGGGGGAHWSGNIGNGGNGGGGGTNRATTVGQDGLGGGGAGAGTAQVYEAGAGGNGVVIIKVVRT